MMNGKITKKERFTEMVNIFTGLERMDLVEFCQHELGLLEKKAERKGDSKKAQAQFADMDIIYNELVVVGRGVTITEFIKARNLEYSNQKVSAMFKKLIEVGKVERYTDKKVVYFKAIVEEVADDDLE